MGALATVSRTVWPADLLSTVYKYSIGHAGCLSTSELTAGPLGKPSKLLRATDIKQIQEERQNSERTKEMVGKSESKLFNIEEHLFERV